MRKTVLYTFIFLAGLVKAQAPQRFYTKFGGDGIDIGYGVKQTLDKNYIVVGSTSSYGAGNTDVYLVKVDTMGWTTWQKTFGGFGNDVGRAVIQLPDSGYVIAGFTNSYGAGGYDALIIKTDKNGNQQWQTTVGGADWDFAYDLVYTTDAHIVICGNTSSFGAGNKDGLMAKLTPAGSIVWQKYYGGVEDDEFVSVQATSDGLYSMAGNTKSYGDLNNDFWLFKVDNLGDSVLSKAFGNANKNERCYDFIEDNLNRLVFCGSFDTSYYNTGKFESYIVKTNLNGSFIAEQKYTGAGNDDKFLSVTKAAANNNYFFSRSVYKPSFAIEAQPFYTDNGMYYINSTTYVGTKDEEAYDVANTKDHGFVMVGYTKSFGLTSEDVFLVKVDSTLLNSTSVVNLPVNKKAKEKSGYYFNNVIYFDNENNENLQYALYSVHGELIDRKFTKENSITTTFLPRGAYILIIENKPVLKFVKTED